ncbi:MAG: FAD-dependent monooxygenase [Lysobacterales bacterium]
MSRDRPHALIIGAGIGGLTTAIALQQTGYRVSVFEQASELSDIGAGITLQPNANRVYASLGLHEAIDKIANLPVYGAYKDLYSGETIQVTGPYRPESTVDSGPVPADVGFRQVHRADFHRLLVEAVSRHDSKAIHLGCCFRKLAQTGTSVTAKFENGSNASGDFLVAADGVRSVVRQALFGKEQREFLNFVAWRGLVPTKSLPDGLIEPSTSSFPGDGRSFVRYKVRHEELVNYAAFARVSDWTDDGWNLPATNEEVLAEFSNACSEVKTIIANTPPGRCFKWGLFGREPLNNWTDRRVTLLGDAAHPMLPFLGHGAAMAIEDGLILARSMHMSDSVEGGLARYQSARLPRANLTMLGARHAGLKLHGIVDAKSEAAAQGYDEAFVSTYDPVTVAI